MTEKTKKIFIPGYLYVEIAAFARDRNKTVDEVANDLLQLGINALDVHTKAKTLLKIKEETKL